MGKKALQLHAVYKKPYLFLLQHMHNHRLNLGFIVVDKLVLLIIFHSMWYTFSAALLLLLILFCSSEVGSEEDSCTAQ